ncbi:hypothetical protein FrEUN1fDRAFT_6387 [Parafrankia sp. EUN1f]|nr:hypothetical protein FrEUN1fDRAFT_6387 [Parafrankia sp. EUN1f]
MIHGCFDQTSEGEPVEPAHNPANLSSKFSGGTVAFGACHIQLDLASFVVRKAIHRIGVCTGTSAAIVRSISPVGGVIILAVLVHVRSFLTVAVRRSVPR